jgi:uncharacterized membrane-anchored protein
MQLPPDHPERLVLADEVHARPPEPLATPTRASFIAVLVSPEERAAEWQHLGELCRLFGALPPAAGQNQYSTPLGPLRLRWERHGEFTSWTFFHGAGASEPPFAETAAAMLPAGWLAALPGRTVTAAHALIIPEAGTTPDAAWLARHFDGHTVVGGRIGGGAGQAYTDFRIHADGRSRFVLLDGALTRHQAGRMLQRLFEIEAYRMLALLALPIARRQGPRILAIEKSLAELTDAMAREDGHDEQLLQELTRLAGEVESGLAASQFRFGACRAYSDLVHTRIAELREQRLPGLQTIEEFMDRRFRPAVATCQTVSQRLHDLSERVSQASSLLATRVGIARERQNQMLLSSMDRRAKLQLRLQQTVEGLSVAAISYYVAGLVGYLAKAAKSVGAPVNVDLVVGVSIPLVAVTALLAIRRARRRIHNDS